MIENVPLIGVLDPSHQIQVAEVLIPGQSDIGGELRRIGDIVAGYVGPNCHGVDFAVDGAVASIQTKAIGHLPGTTDLEALNSYLINAFDCSQ